MDDSIKIVVEDINKKLDYLISCFELNKIVIDKEAALQERVSKICEKMNSGCRDLRF